MKRFIPALVLLIAATLSLSSCKQDDAKGKILRFNLENGKTYEYELVWDFDMETMGQQQKMTIEANYSMQVDGEEGNLKKLTSTYKRFRLDVNVGGINMEIDTDKPLPPAEPGEPQTDQLMARLFAGIKGKQFTMKVDEKGGVRDVSGFENIINSMMDSAALDGPMRNQAELSLRDQFNEQTVRDQFAQVFNIYPNRAVKKGDTWNNSFLMGGRMPFKNDVVYTVKEVEGSKVIIDVNSTISAPDGNKGVSGKQTGVMEVDINNSLVTSSSLTQDIVTEAEGVTVTVKGKGKIKGKEAGK